MPDYQKGKIYKILNTETEDIYIGCTVQPLNKKFDGKVRRKTHARIKLHKLMYELGIKKFYIELVENYPCFSKSELDARKLHWIHICGNLNQCEVSQRQSRNNKNEEIKNNNM